MPIFPLLVAALISIPLLEVYLLIRIGSQIGALSTVALIIATAVLGAFLLRQQGLSTLARVRGSLDRGELPAVEMVEGVILMVTAVLLLTPGFFTDAVGFAVLMPPLRRRLAEAMLARMQFHVVGVQRDGGATYEGEFWTPPTGPGNGGRTLDAPQAGQDADQGVGPGSDDRIGNGRSHGSGRTSGHAPGQHSNARPGHGPGDGRGDAPGNDPGQGSGDAAARQPAPPASAAADPAAADDPAAPPGADPGRDGGQHRR